MASSLVPSVQQHADRIMELLHATADTDASLRLQQPNAGRSDPYFLTLQQNQYKAILSTFRRRWRRKLNPQERASYRYTRYQIARINARLNPGPRTWGRLAGRWLLSRVRLQRRQFRNTHQALQSTFHNTILNANVNNVHAQLKALNFHQNLEGPLTKMMKHGLPEFPVVHTEPQFKDTQFVFHIKKIPGSDNYYLSSFDAIARPNLQSLVNNDPSTLRTRVSLENNEPLTPLQASNLVNRIPFAKIDGGTERWWLMNTNGQIEHTKINLDSLLSEYPIKEIKDPPKRNVLHEKLKKGLSIEITLQLDNGQETKLEARIRKDGKSLSLLDKDGRELNWGNGIDPIQRAQHLLQRQEEMQQTQYPRLHAAR